MRNSTPRVSSSFTLLTLAAASVVVPSGVIAQDSERIESIQVTGSRIARDGYDMPNPVSVLAEADIDAEAPASIAEFAMTLPSIQGSSTATTNSGSLSNGQSGIAALNLRALGTGRTLVLFDGQRSVASSSVGQVDTNTFPQSLVKSIEVVSGGASSAYGSDAIAGVVNFILDKEFTGFKTAVEYGEVAEYGAGNQRIEITAGSDFGNGQGHFLFSAEYYDQDGIRDTVADWQLRGYQGIINPDKSEGAPFFLVGDNIGIGAYTPGGLIVSGPLKGTYFGEGGSVGQLDYGTQSGLWMMGGDWRYAQSSMLGTNSLQADSTRKSVFGRASWALSSTVTAFAQGSWAGYVGDSDYIRPTDRNRRVSIDNAFMPETLRSQMTELGLSTITVSSARADIPLSGANNTRETSRFVLGADGAFDALGLGFNWDTYYQLGTTTTDEHQNPTWNFSALANASDSVFNDAGEIVCRSALDGNADGCVPFNMFGVGVASEAALDYVLGTPRREQEFQQDVFAFNVNTSEIGGWAGDIGLAAGVEWRQESVDGSVDSKYMSGWKYGNYKVTTGQLSVREAYAEVVVPVLESLEFNGAARRTDYSTSGGVNTWKAGFTFNLITDVTLRMTQSRDIRAPNLSELYDAGTARTNAVNIAGRSVDFIQNLQGTPTVGPEEADAFGLGIVYQPTFLPSFAASIDYYDIEVDGVIGFLGAQDVADACLLFGANNYCSQLRYDSSGALQFIDLKYENLNSLLSEGYDFEASYAVPLGAGELSLRGMATHYVQNTTDDGVTAINVAGANTSSTPDWVYRMTARYTLNDLSLNLTARGHSDGVVDNSFIECATNCPVSTAANNTISDNGVDGEWFYDFYAAKDITLAGSTGEIFVSVKNLLDTDPVLIAFPRFQGSENRAGYMPANRNLMDTLGRNFRVGVRYEF